VSEITDLKWGYLDLDNGVARLPDSKTGAKSLVLPASVVDILRGVTSVDGSEYVFPQRAKDAIYQTWERIRTAAGLPGLRIHDLRHNFSSLGVNGSRAVAVIGKP